MDNKIELLAPAGEWDAFIAAVENGADAVYLGGQLFNARQFAGNFDLPKLEAALKYAHARGVNIYLTMNTLILDSELKEAVEFVEKAYSMGIDGIIVQDIGLAGILKALFPGLPLHASTQMTIYNLEGVRKLEKMGFKRVVLARELSIEEIKTFAESTKLELEVFGHGALCVCYSGQCLMSSIIGGRSGNRGKCAQPCRLPYELMSPSGKNPNVSVPGKYLLSPKDLCSINEQFDLIKSGVRSLKIEGRMKNPEYVATVIGIYRKYIDLAYRSENEDNTGDAEIDPADMKKLIQIFNRGGFTKGYLCGKTGRDMISFEKPKNWGIYIGEVISVNHYAKTLKLRLEEDLSLGDGIEVWNGEGDSPGTIVSEIRLNGKLCSDAYKGRIAELGYIQGHIHMGNKVYKTSDKKLNEEARESYSGNSKRKLKIFGRILIRAGNKTLLRVSDSSGNYCEAEGDIIPEAAINKALIKERADEQIRKTGSTPFEFESLDIELEEGLSLPLSELNSVRRKALDKLEQLRVEKNKRNLSANYKENKEKLLYFPGNNRKRNIKVKLSAHFQDINYDIDFSALNIDRIYLPFKYFINDRDKSRAAEIRKSGIAVFVWLPSITRGNYDKLVKANMESIAKMGIDGVLIGNPGSLWIREEYPGLRIACDSSMNIFNSSTIIELKKLGVSGFTYSHELNLSQIRNIACPDDITGEAVIYGRIPLMTSEHCPVGSIEGGFCAGTKCSGHCEKGIFKLKDRLGMEFPVFCDKIDCRSVIFNSNVVFMMDSLDERGLNEIDMLRLNFTDEKPGEIIDIINAHRDVLENSMKLQKYEKLISSIKTKGFTKGHFFRGV